MGNSSSKVHTKYKFDKQNFDKKMAIIQDSIDLTHFYINELSNSVMSVTLSRYYNYNSVTEEYFNNKRKDTSIELLNQNAKVRNLYDFYIQLTLLQSRYENGNMTNDDKRNEIKLVVDTSTSITKMLISELTNDDLYLEKN